MAKNKQKQVSSLRINTQKIKNISEYDVPKDNTRYNEFCNKILNDDLSKKTIKELETLIDSGNGLLTEYYLLDSNNVSQDIISKMQYALSTVIYTMNKMTTEKIDRQQKVQASMTKKTQIDIKNANRDNKNLKSQIESIIGTIFAIIFSVSIPTAAIAGITLIDPRFILPFVATLILFGMIIIIFILSIYNVKIRKMPMRIFITTIIITVLLWALCWNIKIELTPKEINNVEIYNENNN